MTYDHAVKVNGIWYGAGDEVNPTSPVSVTTDDVKQVKAVEPDTKKDEVKQETEKKPATKRSSNKGKASK